MAEAFRVVITFDQSGNLVPLSGSPLKSARVIKGDLGDTIRWDSPHGPLRINFADKSPFGAAGEIRESVDHQITVDGTFKYQCGVTIDGKEFGWPKNPTPGSGGEVVIERRTGPAT